jgi:hypothetical protein
MQNTKKRGNAGYARNAEKNRNTKNAGNVRNYGNAKRKKARAKHSKSKKVLIFLLAFIIIAGVLLIVTNRYIFKVKNWLVGENEVYTREEIIKASGIEEGTELYGFDAGLAEENMRKNLAYAESVSIIRLPPWTVKIDIKTDKAMFGMMLGGDYYILSEKFRVAEKIGVNGVEDFKPPPGVVTIAADNVKKCFVGERAEFEDEDIEYFLRELMDLIKENERASVISSVNIKDKFNVVMNYSDMFLVKFGVFENIYLKALNSFEIIDGYLLERNQTGIIDVSDEKTGSFSLEDNISKSKLYFD